MKKIYAISLAVLYITLSVGVVKSTHYCMGRVLDVDYFSASEDSCMPAMADMHCCSSELELIKIEEDQSQPLFSLNQKQLVEIQTIPVLFEWSIDTYEYQEEQFVSYDDRPPPRDIPIYKLNCTYTYYG